MIRRDTADVIKKGVTMTSDAFNLVLSGGGALGYAHIGVMERLYELQRHPSSLHGVSMGAIVAAVYALGISYEKKITLFEKFFSIAKWLRISFEKGNLVSSDKIEDILDEVFENRDFNALPTDLNILATDYNTGDAVIFNKKNNVPIKTAILASISIPSIFRPVHINGKYYVDGYLSENLPLSSIQNGLESIVVNVTGRNAFAPLQEDAITGLSLVGNLERSVRIIMYNQARSALEKLRTPYVLIEPDVAHFKTSHFLKMDAIRAAGYKAAKAAL